MRDERYLKISKRIKGSMVPFVLSFLNFSVSYVAYCKATLSSAFFGGIFIISLIRFMRA